MAMCEPLPYGVLKCSKYGQLNLKSTWMDIMNVSNNCFKGYILEVDLKYSKKLHDKHSDYPIFPIQQKGYQEKVKNLIGTLND
jgi:hypothetical protein